MLEVSNFFVFSNFHLFSKTEVILRILHVGGTIRTCRKYALRFNKSILQLLKSAIDELTQEEEIEEKDDEDPEMDQITAIASLPKEFYQ